MDILRNKQDGNAISRGQAQLHMIAWKFIIQKHTNAAIEGIPPKKINTGSIWKQIYYMQAIVTRINAILYKTERQRICTAGSKNGRIQSPEHEQKDRTIRENRGMNRMEQNPKKRTSRTKTDQRNNRDINNKNEIR